MAASHPPKIQDFGFTPESYNEAKRLKAYYLREIEHPTNPAVFLGLVACGAVSGFPLGPGYAVIGGAVGAGVSKLISSIWRYATINNLSHDKLCIALERFEAAVANYKPERVLSAPFVPEVLSRVPIELPPKVDAVPKEQPLILPSKKDLEQDLDRDIARTMGDVVFAKTRAEERRNWYRLSPRAFEERVAGLFRSKGFKTLLVGGSGDGGIDIKIWDGDHFGIVQCKRYSNRASPAAARELFGAMTHSRAECAFLVCLGGFSPGAYEFAGDKPIVLLDANDLCDVESDKVPLRRFGQ